MAILALIYFLLVVGIFVAAGFITFHLLRYSLKPRSMYPTVIMFIVITAGLLLINFIAFLNIPFGEIGIIFGF